MIARAARLVIALSLLGAFLLAAEAAVRLAGVQPVPWPAAGGHERFPGVVIDPLLGPRPLPNWSGRWMSGFQVVTDENGFRTTRRAVTRRGDVRVAFLGDSCTFGWGIDTEDTFFSHLDRLQGGSAPPTFEFLNAAYPGESAVSGSYVLRERVLPLKPGLVVLGFSANNAFRFSAMSDGERFRFFSLRRLLLRSRFYHAVASRLASRRKPGHHPRNRQVVLDMPLRDLRRVAAPDAFAAALRSMVRDSRAAGAAVLLLLFPRAAEVSDSFASEDVGGGRLADVVRGGSTNRKKALQLLELSCLGPHSGSDPIARLHRELKNWLRVYPHDTEVREKLGRGANAFVAGDFRLAERRFLEALEQHAESPLALYDLGVTKLALGDTAAGLRHLEDADRLACNVFLHYQVIARTVAADLAVPVVDLMLYFQAHDGTPLYIDPAHPNLAGQRIIAEAVWAAVTRDPRMAGGGPAGGR